MSPGGARTHDPAATFSKLQPNLGIQVTATRCTQSEREGDEMTGAVDLLALGTPATFTGGKPGEGRRSVVLIDDLSLVNIVCGVVDFAFRLH